MESRRRFRTSSSRKCWAERRKLAEADSELFEPDEELRRFTAGKAKPEKQSFSDTARVGLDRRTVSGGPTL